jgi:hypothetical protein
MISTTRAGEGGVAANAPDADFRDLVHTSAMKVTIYEADTPIGEAEIFALDPPMGVAMAKFAPLPAYNVAQHADVVDGEYIEDRGDKLRIEMEDGAALRSQAISIQDWPTLEEREVHFLGILEPSFDELFSDHPHYRDYYDLDLTDEQRAKKQWMRARNKRRKLAKGWSILVMIFLAGIAGALAYLA